MRFMRDSKDESGGELYQGGESRGMNDRVHRILCRYLDKTCKKINYISTNTYSIIMQ